MSEWITAHSIPMLSPNHTDGVEGLSHWHAKTSSWVRSPTDLTNVLGKRLRGESGDFLVIVLRLREFNCPRSCSGEHSRKYVIYLFGVMILALSSQLWDLLAPFYLLQNSENNNLCTYFMNQVEYGDAKLGSSSGTLSNFASLISVMWHISR